MSEWYIDRYDWLILTYSVICRWRMYWEKEGIQTNSILSPEIRAKLSDININEGKYIYSVKVGLLDIFLADSSSRGLPLHVSTPTKLSPKASTLILKKTVTISRSRAATEQPWTRLMSNGQDSKTPQLPKRVTEVTEGNTFRGLNHTQCKRASVCCYIPVHPQKHKLTSPNRASLTRVFNLPLPILPVI
jgi:hypothetical protein